MPSIKFTPAAVARLQAPTKSGRAELVWDRDLRGFGVRLSGKTSGRVYIVQRSIGSSGQKRRVTIGPLDVFDLDEARAKALAVIRELHTGKDPKIEKKRKA